MGRRAGASAGVGVRLAKIRAALAADRPYALAFVDMRTPTPADVLRQWLADRTEAQAGTG